MQYVAISQLSERSLQLAIASTTIAWIELPGAKPQRPMIHASLNVTRSAVPGTPEENDRDLALDFAKGVLIVLVIVGHLIQYILYRGEGFWDSLCFKWIYMFHMPLFMAISGYLSCRALLRKSLTQSVGDRATQLLLPMLFWYALRR